MNRRELLGLGVKLGVLASTTVLPIQEALAASPSRYAAAFALLDRYVEQYLRDMNAPGLTLALADDSGIQRVCAYGMEDLERRIPLNPDRLFHIGSISKSFLGLCLVQLQDEGSWISTNLSATTCRGCGSMTRTPLTPSPLPRTTC